LYLFLKIPGLVIVALGLVVPASRASATVLLDDSNGASQSNAADIVRDAAGLTDAASRTLGGETVFGDDLDNAQIALASPPIEIAGQRWTSFSDATDGPLVDVDSLDYKVFGVSLMDGFISPKRP
jgi:hypothetical protein